MQPEQNRCSKCSMFSKGLVDIHLGTIDTLSKFEISLCWECFQKEFTKNTSGSYTLKK